MNATATNSSNASNQIQTPIDALNSVLATYAKASAHKHDPRDEFLLAVNLIQSAQKLFTGTSAVRDDIATAAGQALRALSSVPWNSVHFPVAQTLLSQTYSDIFTRHQVRDSDRQRILLESLYTFLILAQDNPELVREDILRGIVEDGALNAQVAKAPELNYRANVLKIFSPNKVAAIDLEPLQVIIYRGELVGGGFGPERWGLAYVAGDDAHVLLETGEYVVVRGLSLCLAATKDYDTSELPPYLLACAKLFVPNMLIKAIGGPQALEISNKLSNVFGSFSSDVPILEVPATELQNCSAVLDNARNAVHDSADQGAMRSFNVPNTDLQIIITAQQAAVRPYVTATLVNAGSGTIHMRLDVPREFSATGIYLFPFNGKSAGLISV
jgi:hypothetical protein